MEILILILFFAGYTAIVMEHQLKLDKLIPALLMMVLAWVAISLGLDQIKYWFTPEDGLFSLTSDDNRMALLKSALNAHFEETAEILIFLMGAMTIVELVDHFNGFSVIKGFVKTNKKRTLLWVIAGLAYILSSIIDNLTATIVLITILRKLLANHNDRMWFAGIIIIAANAGGAWSPIGDVTTTMLWIGDKVTAPKLMEFIFIPSLFCIGIPILIASFLKPFSGSFELPPEEMVNKNAKVMLYLGLGMIIFVPVLKMLTNLPPYLGMMFSLAVVATVAEIKTRQEQALVLDTELGLQDLQTELSTESSTAYKNPTYHALSRIEMPSILFFLGILMAVGALESLGIIIQFGETVTANIGEDFFVIILGFASAIIDNVPLVAASMGMFNDPIDADVWHLVAYSAGTGGSLLIIGSAAGVVAMGMEKIPFFWYFKKISWLALLGFLGGTAVFFIESIF